MDNSTEYVTLMSSLPALGPVLGAAHAPINRDRLIRRTSVMRPEHQAEIEALAGILAWSRLGLSDTDESVVRDARRVMPKLSSPVLSELLRARLEMRTAVAALRRRHAGEEAPPPSGTLWGFGRHVRQIEARWREPGFGLERVFPWITSARDKLERRDVAGLERLLLEEAWKQSTRLQGGHEFDFEAVALYMVRWHILDRWTRYDAEAAAAHFSELAEAALAAAPPGLFDQSAAGVEDAA